METTRSVAAISPEDPLAHGLPQGTGHRTPGDPTVLEGQSSNDPETRGAASTSRYGPVVNQENTGPIQRKRNAANLRIGTLNIRGLTSQRRELRDKLNRVAAMMKSQKWAIMALQETHESADAAETIERFNQRIWAFPNPGTARSAGTMFLVMKDLIPAGLTRQDIESTSIVPGRLQLLTFKWMSETVRLLNVYAHNDATQAIPLFEQMSTQRPLPTMVLGDFNHVANAIDRLPNRGPPPSRITEALNRLNENLRVYDTWRDQNRDLNAYTWTSAAFNNDGMKLQSRIDRILLSNRWETRMVRITIEPSLNLSDHAAVVIEVNDPSTPEMGKPRWRIQPEDLEDESATEEVALCLTKCLTRMRNEDPLTVWIETKASIRRIYEGRQLSKRKERGAFLEKIKNDLIKTQRKRDFGTNAEAQRWAQNLEDRINQIQAAKLDRATATARARYNKLGEQVNKYWFNIGKALMTDSAVKALRTQEGRRATTTTDIIETFKAFHENLQTPEEMTDEREEEIERIEQMAADARISDIDAETLRKKLNEREIGEAIRASHNNKSPGIDGIPYEFYKYWLERQDEPEKDRPRPLITRILYLVQATRMESKRSHECAEGLMSLAYKKGDREEPGNYRPLTLLNTDYKIETKGYATKMGTALIGALHRDQAGFVPGRSILDHVKLAKVVAEYCEVAEENGCLIALDQEKAYDRIDHRYLWRVMRAYGIPNEFIQRVWSLYRGATTKITVNREMSGPIKVRRGVRQGDPMSCLLFDLAIEPLAEMLRRSEIKGIQIPGQLARLIVKLFADDTQLYLSKRDNWELALSITRRWCKASTAKFNENKTEVLPLGKSSYRKRVIETGHLSGKQGRGEPFELGIRVKGDGEPVRILGGMIGYNLDIDSIWEPVVAKMEEIAKKWIGRNLSIQGRKLIVNFLLLSRAQYLMMTNPPSTKMKDRIQKAVRAMMWNGKKRGLVRLDELYKPINEGGQNLPDFHCRVEAAALYWIKQWCKPEEEKSTWTIFLDELLKKSAKGGEDPRMNDMRNQTWRNTKGPKSKLSHELRDMIASVEKYGVLIDAPKFDTKSKSQLPVWLSEHSNLPRQAQNSKYAVNLRETHGVMRIRDLWRIQTYPTNGCKHHDKCISLGMKIGEASTKKTSIFVSTPVNIRTGTKDGLDLTRRRKEINEAEREREGRICLDPDVTQRGDINLATRVFAIKGTRDLEPAYRDHQSRTEGDLLEVWTDGSAINNGQANAECAAGVWSEENDYRASMKVPGQPQSNNRGEIAAVVKALQIVPANRPLLLRTDSTYVLNMLDQGHKDAEDKGWMGTLNADLFQGALFLIRTRVAPTYIQKVKAHDGILGNEKADEMAKGGLNEAMDGNLIFPVPQKWKYNGARLATMTFHDLYEGVKHLNRTPGTTKASEIVKKTLQERASQMEERPTQERLWRSIREDPIRKQVTDFLWTALHGRTPCGTHFKGWGDEWEPKMFCECGAIETLEHILSGCVERPWVEEAWREATDTLQQAKATGPKQWEAPNYDSILGASLFKSKRIGETRLYKIVVTETAYAIWKLRNNAKIRGENITPGRARNYIRLELERRATLDFGMAKIKGKGAKKDAKRLQEVRATWNGLVAFGKSKLSWIPSDYG